MKIVFLICRYLVGLLFIISGFTKAIDPQGTAIKLQEYFYALGFDGLTPYALAFSILLNTLEFLVGFLILINVHLKIASILAFLLMLLFIPLTLYLAITGRVNDCGCFGDAIKLSDWETFYKNLFLIIPIVLVFVFRNKFQSKLTKLGRLLSLIAGFIFVMYITWHGYRYLPLIDFRPFHIGANIVEKTGIPEDKSQATKRIYFYEKNGEIKQFDESNYPWEDTSWHFVRQEEQIDGKTYEPPLEDFYIEHPEEGDITRQIIEDEGFTFLLVSSNLVKGHWKSLPKINAIADLCKKKGMSFVSITSSTEDEIKSFLAKNSPPSTFCTADEKMVKTIIRSNPGLILLYQGNVLAKWSYADIPSAEKLNTNLLGYSLNKIRQKNSKLLILIMFVSLALVVVLIKLFFKVKNNY